MKYLNDLRGTGMSSCVLGPGGDELVSLSPCVVFFCSGGGMGGGAELAEFSFHQTILHIV